MKPSVLHAVQALTELDMTGQLNELNRNEVKSLSHVRLSATPWTAAWQASLSFHHPLEPAQTHVYGVGDAIQPSRPLLSPSPPAFNLAQHQGLFQ